jgi:ribosomal protein S18 acetylase RimI-like enzyme
VIHYRTFRNPDPPRLVEIWNACAGRGAAFVRLAAVLEYFVFAKPYFDPEGLIVAEADGRPVGFALGGFGPNADGTGLDTSVGVACSLGVLPAHRRQGVGTQLLHRCEDYLRRRGAAELRAGPLAPRNPFTFGLYGGSSSPGFLDSDALARPFLERNGYRAEESCLVLQRPLDRVNVPVDARLSSHRQRYEIHAASYSHAGWWRECVAGPIELIEYRLLDRLTHRVSGRATLWEMDGYSQQWNEHAVGIVDLEVVPEQRRHGLAKFMLSQLLRHLHEQFFSLIEIQAAPSNAAAVGLLFGLGFTQVDTGRCYKLVAERK